MRGQHVFGRYRYALSDRKLGGLRNDRAPSQRRCPLCHRLPIAIGRRGGRKLVLAPAGAEFNRSFAHDNDLIEQAEARFNFDAISAFLRFLKSVDTVRFGK